MNKPADITNYLSKISARLIDSQSHLPNHLYLVRFGTDLSNRSRRVKWRDFGSHKRVPSGWRSPFRFKVTAASGPSSGLKIEERRRKRRFGNESEGVLYSGLSLSIFAS